MFKAIALLAIAGSLQTPLLEKCGDLPPWGEVSYVIPQVKKDQHITAHVLGTGKGGELNCYLLVHNFRGHGWKIAVQYEGTRNSCDLEYTSSIDQPIKLWLSNDSKVADGYKAQAY